MTRSSKSLLQFDPEIEKTAKRNKKEAAKKRQEGEGSDSADKGPFAQIVTSSKTQNESSLDHNSTPHMAAPNPNQNMGQNP